MNPYFLSIILLAAGVAFGPVMAVLAARRTTHQPSGVELDAEREVLSILIKDPSGYVYVAEMKSDAFLTPGYPEVWEAIVASVGEVEIPEPGSGRKKFEAASLLVDADAARETLLKTPGEIGDVIRGMFAAAYAPTRVALLRSGSKVYSAHEDRGERFGGSAPLSRGDAGEAPLVRRYQKPSRVRSIWTSAFLAGVGATAPYLSGFAHVEYNAAWLVTSLTIFTLGLGSIVWALVDIDTMYLDYPTFLIGGGLAWAGTVLAVGLSGDWSRLIAGGAVVLGAAVVFEGGSRIYARLRGEPGMGGGDTIIAIATAGVPAALTGNWMLGYYTILGAMILSIAGWSYLRLRNKTSTDQPFAFGPYLALGWIAAWLVMSFLDVL